MSTNYQKLVNDPTKPLNVNQISNFGIQTIIPNLTNLTYS
nr:MAG TPA: hypothetical protein [Caudoviricetes sp.]